GPGCRATLSRSCESTDYDDQAGGGSSKVEGYDVRVRDCAQNIAQGFVRSLPGVFQENGTSYGYGTLARSYTGAWGRSTCSCWSGRSDRWTSAAGARGNFV